MLLLSNRDRANSRDHLNARKPFKEIRQFFIMNKLPKEIFVSKTNKQLSSGDGNGLKNLKRYNYGEPLILMGLESLDGFHSGLLLLYCKGAHTTVSYIERAINSTDEIPHYVPSCRIRTQRVSAVLSK